MEMETDVDGLGLRSGLFALDMKVTLVHCDMCSSSFMPLAPNRKIKAIQSQKPIWRTSPLHFTNPAPQNSIWLKFRG